MAEGGIEISLEEPGPPAQDEATAAQLRELITKGAMGSLVFQTDDARGLYKTFKARGVTDFTQEPTERLVPTLGEHVRGVIARLAYARCRSIHRPKAPRFTRPNESIWTHSVIETESVRKSPATRAEPRGDRRARARRPIKVRGAAPIRNVGAAAQRRMQEVRKHYG